MKKSDYDEAVYLANLINSGRVPDWSVSYEGIKLLAKALACSVRDKSEDLAALDRSMAAAAKETGE